MTIHMNCDNCGHRQPSDLARWANWYTGGETWWETCHACGREYQITLSTTERTQR